MDKKLQVDYVRQTVEASARLAPNISLITTIKQTLMHGFLLESSGKLMILLQGGLIFLTNEEEVVHVRFSFVM
jgi:hypothetical protein